MTLEIDPADDAVLLLIGRVARNGAVLEVRAQELLRHLLDLPRHLADALLPDDMNGTIGHLKRLAPALGLSPEQEVAVRTWAQQAQAAWADRSLVVHSTWFVSSCSDDLVRTSRKRYRPAEAESWPLPALQQIADEVSAATRAQDQVWLALGLPPLPDDD